MKQEEVGTENGQVFDSSLSNALQEEIDAATNVANGTDTETTIADAYNALKAAVDAFEAQPVRWQVTATAENGVIGVEETAQDGQYAVDNGADVVFSLSPNEGYSLENTQINVTAGLDYSISGSQLTVKNVTGPVNVSVFFAPENTDGGNNGGNGGNGGNGNDNGNGNGTGNGSNGSDGNNGSGSNNSDNGTNGSGSNTDEVKTASADNPSASTLVQTDDPFDIALFAGAAVVIIAGAVALVAWRKSMR